MNLLSGAAGALWGSDALAGVLDLQTLASTENRTELSLEGGERGREALALRWAGARRSRALPSPSITSKPRARTRPAPGRRKMAMRCKPSS